MMYYGVLTLCALMFSTQFFFTQMYSKSYGSDLKAIFVSSVGNAAVGILTLSAMNGFKIGYTHFSFLMATLAFLNGVVLKFCSLKSLDKINLSLYSLFSMLGGMTLPFIAGILFFGEKLTFGKVICFFFIVAAFLFTIEKDEKKTGYLYYIGVFVFNGMSGVIAKIFQAAPFEKVSAVEYSFLGAVIGLVGSIIPLIFIKGDKRPLTLKPIVAICGGGIINRLANLFLIICLTYIPASAQYPFITGGTMIFSTLIAFLTHQKPSKKEIISVVLSFAGILILVLVN